MTNCKIKASWVKVMRQVKEISTLINYFKNSVLISLCFDEEIFIMVFESKLSAK